MFSVRATWSPLKTTPNSRPRVNKMPHSFSLVRSLARQECTTGQKPRVSALRAFQVYNLPARLRYPARSVSSCVSHRDAKCDRRRGSSPLSVSLRY